MKKTLSKHLKKDDVIRLADGDTAVVISASSRFVVVRRNSTGKHEILSIDQKFEVVTQKEEPNAV